MDGHLFPAVAAPAAVACPMANKRLRCRIGVHSYVRAHPADERYQGPDERVCRHCGKRGGTLLDIPAAGLTGGPWA